MPDLSDSVNWSEVDADNNNAAPNGWPEGMMPSGVNDAARADRGALKRFWNKINPVQTITPASGVYTFMTANPAYPTAYVDGEIYWFRVHGESVGGDYFQVNALAPKPIWKRVGLGATGYVPIMANDFRGDSVQLVYGSGLNTGSGAFVLENPFVPISGDGSGTNVSVPGGLAVTGGPILVNGDLLIGVPGHTDKTIGYLTRHNQAAGSRKLGVTASSPGGVYFPLEEFAIIATSTVATGSLAATGYNSRSGTPGPYQINLFNIQWAPGDATATPPVPPGAHLWIDSTDLGPIVTAPPGANLVTPGDLTVGGALHVTNAATVGGALSVTNAATVGGALSVTGGISSAGLMQGQTLHSLAGTSVDGALTVGGALTGQGAILTQLQVTGNAAIDGSLGLAGNLSGNIATLTQLQLNGNAAITGNVGIAGNLVVGGTITGTLVTAMVDQLDALSARVQALEDQR